MKKWSEIREGTYGIETVLLRRLADAAAAAGEDALEQSIKVDDQTQVAKEVASALLGAHGEMGALMVVGAILATIQESSDTKLGELLGTKPDGTVNELSPARDFDAAHHATMEALSGPAFHLVQNIWSVLLVHHQAKAVAAISEE
jgi:hypothetical protein